MSDNGGQPTGPELPPVPDDELAGGVVFASGWRRFVAALIDNLTWLIGLNIVLGYVPPSVWEDHPGIAALVVFAALTAWFNYFALCEWKWGQTIGKNAMGMRVVSLDRTRPSYGQSSIRNLLRLVDFFVVGWVLIATSERKQRLGDRAAGTVVVGKPPGRVKHYREAPPGAPEPSGVPAAAPGPASATLAAAAPEPSGPEEPAGPEAPAGAGGTGPAGAGHGRMRGLPRVSWDLGETIKWLLIGLLIGAFIAPALVLPFDPRLDSAAAILAAQAMLGTTLIVVALGVASGWRFESLRRAASRLGVRRIGWSAIGIALLTLLAYYAAALAFAALVVQPEQDDIAGELGFRDPNLLVAIAAALMIALLAPVAEELFFRGMVFGGLRTTMSLWPAAIVSGIVFGLPHVLTGPLASVQLAGLGVALAWLYERTGSIWPCILIHVINNSLALAVTT